MEKILVLGKDGQLGRALQAISKQGDWKFIDKDTLNLYETETILGKLEREDFDVLINCAAYTAVDKAEDESEIAQRINGAALAPIAEACRMKKAILIHLSTDYVYGEVLPVPLREDAETNPQSIYGQTKLSGEEAVRSILDRHIIIRTSWLYGSEGHNFLNTMLKLGATQDKFQVVYDQVGAPTFVEHLAGAIVDIVKMNISHFGTFHYSNEGVCSWYDFAQAIFELTGKEVEIEPVNTDKFPTKAKRPNYSVLDKQKIKDTFGIHIPYWRNGLRACLHKMNKLK
ncbi:dTDP-4-dehydrorhamnose reductase [Cryomorpha ignava]|uniref:dTDP-4-dehydrorhamnose reductase n=1 Tax=Cryomorpha ignava TaxID=101383 RepID=A0A7K3WRG7_9FLAO|nr:dTDP-4-dehydrorhamnose reductase [Cryomorpha ignava]NEN24128.1 dTDP-4-dehydrorhamnose reductase [Cryomorpha ignava]